MAVCPNTQKDIDICPCQDCADHWSEWAKGAIKPVTAFALEDMAPASASEDAQQETHNDGFAAGLLKAQATIDHYRTLYEDSQEQARQLVESANKRTERIRHLWYAVVDGDMDRMSVSYALKDLL